MPAMVYLHHMASVHKQTVGDIMKDLKSQEIELGSLADWLAQELINHSSPITEDTGIIDIPCNMLGQLASKLSRDPRRPSTKAITWKNLAALHLKNEVIQSIECSQSQAGRLSPTEDLIDLITTLKPSYKIAELAKMLVEIERVDVLMYDMFHDCIKNKCIQSQELSEDELLPLFSLR